MDTQVARVRMQNFATVRRAILEEIANRQTDAKVTFNYYIDC